MTNPDVQAAIRRLVAGVYPCDAREAADQGTFLTWIDSGQPLFRVAKPATPPQHLAVYAALIDDEDGAIMVVHHRGADAWLPPGGHVEQDEDPRAAVTRELGEELGISPPFHAAFGDLPMFLSITRTRGPGSHLDATLWFVFALDRGAALTPDGQEIRATRWRPLADTSAWAEGAFDPEMRRFTRKLAQRIAGARATPRV